MDPNPQSTNHSVKYLLSLILLASVKITTAINFQPFPEQDIYTRPDYGVIFRPIPNTFVPTDSYFHVFFELPFPVIPVFPQLPTVDNSQCLDQSQSFSAHLLPNTDETHRYFYGLLQPALRRAISLSPYDPASQLAPEVRTHFMDVYSRFINSPSAQLNATLYCYSILRSE